MEKLWLIKGIKVKVVINLFNSSNNSKLNYQVGLNDVFGFKDICAFAFYLKTTRGYEHYDICYCDEHTDINDEVNNVKVSDKKVNKIIGKLCDLQSVKDELAGEIEYMMNQYFEDNDLPDSECERVLEAHKHQTTDGFYYDFIDNYMFLKCIGLSNGEITIDEILEDLNRFEELSGDKNALEIFDYFDWDKYCEYYYTKTVIGKKEMEVSFCDKTFIVFEAWPDIASGTICTDDEGCNMLFDTYEEAEIEASNCQCGYVLEV
jgi:hypothetical protein